MSLPASTIQRLQVRAQQERNQREFFESIHRFIDDPASTQPNRFLDDFNLLEWLDGLFTAICDDDQSKTSHVADLKMLAQALRLSFDSNIGKRKLCSQTQQRLQQTKSQIEESFAVPLAQVQRRCRITNRELLRIAVDIQQTPSCSDRRNLSRCSSLQALIRRVDECRTSRSNRTQSTRWKQRLGVALMALLVGAAVAMPTVSASQETSISGQPVSVSTSSSNVIPVFSTQMITRGDDLTSRMQMQPIVPTTIANVQALTAVLAQNVGVANYKRLYQKAVDTLTTNMAFGEETTLNFNEPEMRLQNAFTVVLLDGQFRTMDYYRDHSVGSLSLLRSSGRLNQGFFRIAGPIMANLELEQVIKLHCRASLPCSTLYRALKIIKDKDETRKNRIEDGDPLNGRPVILTRVQSDEFYNDMIAYILSEDSTQLQTLTSEYVKDRTLQVLGKTYTLDDLRQALANVNLPTTDDEIRVYSFDTQDARSAIRRAIQKYSPSFLNPFTESWEAEEAQFLINAFRDRSFEQMNKPGGQLSADDIGTWGTLGAFELLRKGEQTLTEDAIRTEVVSLISGGKENEFSINGQFASEDVRQILFANAAKVYEQHASLLLLLNSTSMIGIVPILKRIAILALKIIAVYIISKIGQKVNGNNSKQEKRVKKKIKITEEQMERVQRRRRGGVLDE